MTQDLTTTRRNFRDAIDRAWVIGITTHIDVDGDAVGSVIAAESFFARMGKKVMVVCHDRVPDGYHFLGRQWEPFSTGKEYPVCDCMIVLDCPQPKRVGAVEPMLAKAACVLNIDHHVSNDAFGTIAYVDAEASATAEILCELFRMWNQPVNAFEAAALFTGLSTDTGSFRHGNTTARTFEAAAELLRCGLDLAAVNESLYSSFPLRRFELTRRLMQDVVIDTEARVGWCVLTPEMLSSFGAKRSDAEAFIDNIKNVAEVDCAMFLFAMAPDKTKVSLRSKHDYDVDAIAKKFGGGGHRKAAGCLIEKPVAEARQLLLKEFRQCRQGNR